MNKFRKTGLLIISLIMVAVMICGCGSKTEDAEFNKGIVMNSKAASMNGGAGFDDNAQIEENSDFDESADYDDDVEADENADFDEASSSETQPTGKTDNSKNSRKIIEYISLNIETKTFDKLIDDITATVEKSGGYIENSSVGGNSFYGTDRRTAELKIRIPKAKQSAFSDFVSKNSNVVNQSITTDDVTNQYIDTQSRIKALKIEKETLEKLLKKSKNVSDTLEVYDKLTSVIAEIESYQSRLNQMDNLIDYTTFTVYVEEVEKETNVEKQSWFSKTVSNLVNNLSNIKNGFLNALSFVISALPYWILIAVAVVVIVIIIRRRKKKKAKKDDETEQS